MSCECYRAEKNFVGKIGLCWGTAERDACSCCGDKSKCDFYPSVREEGKKPVTNYDRVRAMSVEEMAEFLAEYRCVYKAPNCREANCEKCWLDWLKQEVSTDG